jgi:ABC-type bacteriocin/lantibiotic exporter with double-glycine peptidase domain
MINFEDLNDSTIKNMLPIIGLYFTASYRLLPSLNRIMGAYNYFRFAKLGMLGIFNELKNQNKSTYEESTERINDFKILKFDNVNFHYAEEEKVLESVNFEIEKGDKVLIQGETGSGKSTVLNLIFGLIKPTGGKITFNGKQIKLNDILKSNLIGYTPQNTHLLDGTLQFNVSLEESSEKIDHKKLTQILKICELKGFLDKLEKKIELNVGESGKMLSGGQKQRVGLARAIYKNPQILIFDESTSSLDKKTEKLILKKILENFPHKTMIFVSHDLNLIEQIKFNKIVKL